MYDATDRFESSASLGGQVGMYLLKRIRLVARVTFPVTAASDTHLAAAAINYETLKSDSPKVMYGASAGVALIGTKNFVLAPSLWFLRTNEGDYGTALGVSLPLEWVLSNGIRFGAEPAIAHAFGGSFRQRCVLVNVIPAPCTVDETRTLDRSSGMALYVQLQVGWGFNYPKP
jgi:hypothetical protein